MRNVLLVYDSDRKSESIVEKTLERLDVQVIKASCFEEAQSKTNGGVYLSCIVFDLEEELEIAPFIETFSGPSKLLCYRNQSSEWLEKMLAFNIADECYIGDENQTCTVLYNKVKRLISSRFSKRLYGIFNVLMTAYPFPIVCTREHRGESARVVFYNEPFRRVYSLEGKELQGKHLNLFNYYEVDEVKHKREGAPGYYLTKHRRSSSESSFKTFDVHLVPLGDPTSANGAESSVEYTVAFEYEVNTDVSFSKRLLGQLDVYKKSLARQEEFLASVAHDIRKPLNNIVGLTELLKGYQLDEEQNDVASALSQSGKNLRKMIDDLLDLSKMDSGKYEIVYEYFDIRKFVDGIKLTFENDALKKGLDFQVLVSDKVPVQMEGDENRLFQVLTNLLVNAFKFTSKGGVTLSIELASISDSELELDFVVKDTGIGVKPENLEKLFTSYTQAERGHDRTYGGTGLGLSICKKLTNLMKGDITVKSVWGEGSSFTVSLPFNYSPVCPLPEESNEHGLAGKRIMLVDDNELTNMVLSRVLRNWQADVFVFTSALSALQSKAEVDILLADVQLPDMNGIELSNEMKKKYRGLEKELPVLGISAFPYPIRTHAKGVLDSFLLKPLNSSELFSKVTELLARKSDQVHSINDGHMEYQVIDTEKISGFASGDAEFIQQLIAIFLKRTPEYMEELNLAVKAKDWTKIKMMAHKVKPTFTYVGMEAFTEKVGSIEDLAIKKDLLGIQMIMDEVWDQCQLAFDEFRDYSKSLD